MSSLFSSCCSFNNSKSVSPRGLLLGLMPHDCCKTFCVPRLQVCESAQPISGSGSNAVSTHLIGGLRAPIPDELRVSPSLKFESITSFDYVTLPRVAGQRFAPWSSYNNFLIINNGAKTVLIFLVFAFFLINMLRYDYLNRLSIYLSTFLILMFPNKFDSSFFLLFYLYIYFFLIYNGTNLAKFEPPWTERREMFSGWAVDLVFIQEGS